MDKDYLVSLELVEQRIFLVRGEKIMMDFHLAEMYNVDTKLLKRAVRRNRDRFPEDFCFELSFSEWQNLRSQFGASSWGGIRYLPFAFTEQGVAMLSCVLHSSRAVKVNVQIMRVFVRLRELLSSHQELALRLRQLEMKIERQDADIRTIFEAIRHLMAPHTVPPKRRMGFHIEEPMAAYRIRRKRKSH